MKRILHHMAVLAVVLTLTAIAGAESYGYDALGRLTRVTYDDGTTIRYVYDTRGNLTGRFVDAEPPPYTYCQAKLTSCGTLPAISASGTSSATSPSGFTVSATDATAQKPGVWLYTNAGPALPALPFSGGLLCVGLPVGRGPLSFSTGTPGTCDGQFSLDVNAFAQGLAGGNAQPFLSVPGTKIHCQWWGRDSVANGPLLSNAMAYFVGP